ncbi:AfsR/SARP family transcriptional regulator [Dactylosporangium sp. NBC_01737]|uniref:AfsR/SARP family transcriptional regulator n=1 Tax=Dactylosporangium sp. NBC_01737 TaxID=2975959 RepID=UPI003FA3D91C
MRLLGPIDVLVDGAARPVRGQRRKAVLAVLGLHPGEVVSTGRLVDLVWGDAAPPNAVNALQSHVSYLRRTLDDKAAITSHPPGYLLSGGEAGSGAGGEAGADCTDVAVAERLIAAGLHAADHATRARHLHAALELWRGTPWPTPAACRGSTSRPSASASCGCAASARCWTPGWASGSTRTCWRTWSG